MNMELNARLIFLPTDFDQISQLYDTLSKNVYYGRWKACIKHDEFILVNPRVLNCSEVTYMGYKV